MSGRNTGVRQSPEKLKQVLQMRRNGEKLETIGLAVGVSAERVRQILEKEAPELSRKNNEGG